MDIELFSSLVRKLIIESDEVFVPGLGTFSATLVPASFSDRGYTINPPYRKLDFVPSGNEASNGGEVPAIVRRISSARKIAEAQAVAELTECVEAISARLEAERLAELPGLGKLRLTKEGEIFFVAAEDLNIYPEGFGLEPVSLKNKEAQESAKEETESAAKTADLTPDGTEIAESAAKSAEMTPDGTEITEPAAKSPETTPIELLIDPLGGDSAPKSVESAPLGGDSAPKPVESASLGGDSDSKPAETMSEPAQTAEPAAEPAPAVTFAPVTEPVPVVATSPAAEPAQATEPTPAAEPAPITAPAPASVAAAQQPRKKLPVALRVLLVVVALLIVAVVALRLLGTYAPDFIDRLLYSPEELEILRQGL